MFKFLSKQKGPAPAPQQPEPRVKSIKAEAKPIMLNPTTRQRIVRSLGRIGRLYRALDKPTCDDERRAMLEAELHRRKTLIELSELGIKVPGTARGCEVLAERLMNQREA